VVAVVAPAVKAEAAANLVRHDLSAER
jgi:hypothetical protein